MQRPATAVNSICFRKFLSMLRLRLDEEGEEGELGAAERGRAREARANGQARAPAGASAGGATAGSDEGRAGMEPSRK